MSFKKQSTIFSTLSNKTYSILLNWDKARGSTTEYLGIKLTISFMHLFSIYIYFLLKNVL